MGALAEELGARKGWSCGGPGSTGHKADFWAGPKVERGGYRALPPVTLTTAGPGGNLARSGAPPLARAGRSRESCEREEARARP